MSVTEKLVTVAENTVKVYDAGQRATGARETVVGNPCTIDYVHPANIELDVRIESKNLYNGEIQQGVYSPSDGSYMPSLTTFVCTKVAVDGNTAYTISISSDAGKIQFITYYSRDGVVEAYYPPSGLYQRFTTPSWCTEVAINIAGTSGRTITPSDVTNVQLEKGTTATEYTPYVADLTQKLVFIPATGLGYNADENGVVRGIKSVDTGMNLVANPDVTITVEYYLDAERKINDMEQTLVTLGGDII